MRKFVTGVAIVCLFCAISVTGCGGHSETVVQPSNEGGGGLSAEDQQGYEEAMKAQAEQAGPSGN